MREGAAADDVADRPEPVGDPLVVVDLQEATRSVHTDGVEADVVDARLAAGREQQLFGLERLVAARDVEPLTVVRDSVDRDAGTHVHAL